jgi:dihydroxyacetone kinase-like protein
MNALTVNDFINIFGLLRAEALKNKDYYIELDSVMGDGDLGLTIAAAFEAAEKIAHAYREADIGLLCIKAGMAMAKTAPSTMGTLMATGFMRAGKAVKEVVSLDIRGNAVFWQAFVQGMMERGNSKPGEKTIIDALFPAAQAFETVLSALDSGSVTLAQVYKSAKIAAERGLEATKTMVAQHGRAAYYQEKSKSKQDPGATVGCMVVSVFADYVLNS